MPSKPRKPDVIRSWIQAIILPQRNTKWLLSFGSLIVSTYFFRRGFIDQQVWKEILIYIVGIFSVANVGATFAHKKGEGEALVED